jgi:hypothetical protein
MSSWIDYVWSIVTMVYCHNDAPLVLSLRRPGNIRLEKMQALPLVHINPQSLLVH